MDERAPVLGMYDLLLFSKGCLWPSIDFLRFSHMSGALVEWSEQCLRARATDHRKDAVLGGMAQICGTSRLCSNALSWMESERMK